MHPIMKFVHPSYIISSTTVDYKITNVTRTDGRSKGLMVILLTMLVVFVNVKCQCNHVLTQLSFTLLIVLDLALLYLQNHIENCVSECRVFSKKLTKTIEKVELCCLRVFQDPKKEIFNLTHVRHFY